MSYPFEVLSAYARIFERHRPYAVATSALRQRLDEQPLGQKIAAKDWYDPMRAGSGPFLDLVHRLDGLTFGPLGMTMPRWALYDCGQLPGLVFGLGADVLFLKPRVRRALSIPSHYRGLVPLSMYIAIPTLDPDCWLGHSICSLNEVSPGVSPPGMRLLTMALGLACLKTKIVAGLTQWTSPKLSVHAQFAPLKLQAAWMPAHSEPDSCVFHFPVSPDRIRRALAAQISVPHDAVRLDVAQEDDLRTLQTNLEAGQEAFIVGPPAARGACLEVPMAYGESKHG